MGHEFRQGHVACYEIMPAIGLSQISVRILSSQMVKNTSFQLRTQRVNLLIGTLVRTGITGIV